MVRGLMVAKRKHQSSGLHFAEMDIRKKKIALLLSKILKNAILSLLMGSINLIFFFFYKYHGESISGSDCPKLH
jgi:hypothetical protein